MRHSRYSRSGIAALAVLGAGQAAATLLVAVALTLAVAEQYPLAGHALADPRSLAAHTLAGPRSLAVGLLAAAFVVRALLSWAEQVVAQRTSARVADELRGAVLASALRRGPAWVAGYRSSEPGSGPGRLIAVLTTGLDALRPWFSGYLPSLILGAILPPLVIVAMAFVDRGSALVALLTLPLIPILGALIGWATQARARQRWDADARLAGHFLDVVRGLSTLRVYGRAERQVGVIAAMTERHRSATMRVLRVAFLSSTALDLVGTLSVGLIAVEAGLRVAAGHLALAPALLVILLAPEVYRPLREMAARYHASADAAAVIDDVDAALTGGPDSHRTKDTNADTSTGMDSADSTDADADIVNTPGSTVDSADPDADNTPGRTASSTGPDVDDIPGRTAGSTGPSVNAAHGTAAASTTNPTVNAARGADPASTGDPGTDRETAAPGVAAWRLRVRYPSSTADALALDHFEAPAGRITALRGPSGAGKTTALRVLAGLQVPDAGRVHVSGPWPLYLPQRPVLPHARVVADVFDTADDVREGLESVGLDREIRPDTPLGELGQGVSAGQRQRLALAAMLRRAHRGPVALLLDEPTAHLDPEAERRVIAHLREAADRGCAVVVVAHRPALLAAADSTINIHPPTPGTSPSPGISAPILDLWRPNGEQKPLSSEATTPRSAELWGAGHPMPDRAGKAGVGRQPGMARAAAAVALGAGSWIAGLVLTGAAAWLLVRASTLPPVLTLSVAVVLVRASAVARPLLRYAERLVSHDYAFARLGARRSRVYAALIPRVPGPRLHRRGYLLARLVDDVDAQVDGTLRGRMPTASAAVVLGVAAAPAILLQPAAGISLAVGIVVSAVIAPLVAARLAVRHEAATAQARTRLRDAVVETVDGIEELAAEARRAPTSPPDASDRRVQTVDGIEELAAEARRAPTSPPGAGNRGDDAGEDGADIDAALAVPRKRGRLLARIEARAARASGLATAISTLGWGVAVVGAALAGAGGGLSREAAAVLLLGVVALGEPVAALPDAAVARVRSAAARARLTTLAAEPTGPARPEDPESPAGNDVHVRGLSAGWDPARLPALEHLDLDLLPGSRVAILGPSGSGKSTLAAVLAGLLEPRGGTVTVGGVRPGDLPPGTVALVSDETDHLFASTLRENLRVGRPGADDETLRAVLTRVGLPKWGDRLDDWLGTGGTTVSGGERRRLATARALLSDPQVLVLDEPTEGLDEPAAEALMADLLAAAAGEAAAGQQEAGEQKVGERTVLLLTHRTEGLSQVDRCLTLSAAPSC